MTTLNKNNWEKLRESGQLCVYRHKVRKHIELTLNTQNMLGRFRDTRKSGVEKTLGIKPIVWS